MKIHVNKRSSNYQFKQIITFNTFSFSFAFGIGTPEIAQILQDRTIEEKEHTACETDNTKNDDDNIKSNPLNTTHFYQLKESSMAIYYGWQLVCLLIFMFTAYETLQNM